MVLVWFCLRVFQAEGIDCCYATMDVRPAIKSSPLASIEHLSCFAANFKSVFYVLKGRLVVLTGVCTDKQTPAYTCKQQKAFGACTQSYITDGGFCNRTCGRCNTPVPAPPPTSAPTSAPASSNPSPGKPASSSKTVIVPPATGTCHMAPESLDHGFQAVYTVRTIAYDIHTLVPEKSGQPQTLSPQTE